MTANSNIITLKEVLKKREISIEFLATTEQKQEIIEECDLNDIVKLKAKFKIIPIAHNKGLGVEFYLSAQVLHECVVTLAPVLQTIKQNYYLRYLPDHHDADFSLEDSDIYLSDGHEYEDDILKEGQINLYDIVHEYLVLALDPLPRVANVEFKGYIAGSLTPEEKKNLEENLALVEKGQPPKRIDNPFAALAELKKLKE